MNNTGIERLFNFILELSNDDIKRFRQYVEAHSKGNSGVLPFFDVIFKATQEGRFPPTEANNFPNHSDLVRNTYKLIVRSLIIIKAEKSGSQSYYHGKAEALRSKRRFMEAIELVLEVIDVAGKIEDYALIIAFQQFGIELIRDYNLYDTYREKLDILLSQRARNQSCLNEIAQFRLLFEDLIVAKDRRNQFDPSGFDVIRKTISEPEYQIDRPFQTKLGEIYLCLTHAQVAATDLEFEKAINLFQRAISVFDSNQDLKESKNWLIALVCMVVITIGWGIICFFIIIIV